MISRKSLTIALMSFALAVAASPALADSMGFSRQSSNASTDVAGQLTVDVTFSTSGGTTTASFVFTNDVGTASSLTDVYFRDDLDTHLDFDSGVITASSGVSYAKGAAPPGVPGAFGWGNKKGIGFSMDSSSGGGGTAANGVDASTEWVTVAFDLVGSSSKSDVLEALATTGLTSSVIGLHVQAIGTESDWFYNDTTVPVPEPGSLALVTFGLFGLAYRRRKRRA